MILPQINLTSAERGSQIISLIIQEITSKGFISFARFMEMALYTPNLGYYSATHPKFGRQGDFVTAPEISPLFARCLAKQCQQVLLAIPNGDILEIGAGTGKLAVDLLLELEQLNSLPEHYYIFEISTDLQSRQQQLLQEKCPHLYSRIVWLNHLPTEKISGIILANEVMDALPFHCFHIEKNTIKERSVIWDENHFTWTLTEPSVALNEQVAVIQQECDLPCDYTSEINLLLPDWIRSLENTLKSGVLLLLDYGYGRREYYHPDRTQGTLMCYYQHHFHADPFKNIGMQDITAHIDFTLVAESAIAAGLTCHGYTTQSSFLLACGLLELADQSLSAIDAYQQNQAIKTLTMPSQMGEAIKVMGLTKNLDISLLGFSLYDRRQNL